MEDISRNNIERFLGYSDFYNEHRPIAPDIIVKMLIMYLNDVPNRVVDVGCGTGLSSFVWLDHAKDIIGVEPNDDMRSTAINEWHNRQKPENLKFVKGLSDHLNINSESVDILTCSQSFHWMDPQPTLREFSRVLRKGGIFATYDCDWPPSFNREIEEHYQALITKSETRMIQLAPAEQLAFKWNKQEHLQQIKDSQLFSFSKEIVFHNWIKCDAIRYTNIALSQGGLQTALKLGAVDLNDAIFEFQQHVKQVFGGKKQDILFSYRMRIGIK